MRAWSARAGHAARTVAGIGALLLAAAGAPAPADEPVLLRHSFAEGRARYLTVKTSVDKATVVSFFPDPFGSRDEREWWVAATAGAAAADGYAPLTWSIERLQARHRDQMGREQKPAITFDSLRPAAEPRTASLAAWAPRSLTLHLDPAGRLRELANPPDSRPALPAPGSGLTAGTMEPPTIDEMTRVVAELYGSYIPDRPVSPGDAWTSARRIHRAPYGTLSSDVRYQLRGVENRGERRIAKISFHGEQTLTPDPVATRPGGDRREHRLRKGAYDGEVEFDVSAGRMVAFRSRDEINVELIMSGEVKDSARASPAPTTATATASAPATQPTTQPAGHTLSFSFQLSETRELSATASDTAPVKPIVVNAAPAATQPKPPVTAAPPITHPVQPSRPTTRPGATAPPPPPS